MRKLLLVNMAVAMLAAGVPTPDRAEAATLPGSAAAGTAIEAALIEEVAHRNPRPRHRYGSIKYPYGYKPYSPPSRINRPGGFHFR
jgi:hypothetical protein